MVPRKLTRSFAPRAVIPWAAAAFAACMIGGSRGPIAAAHVGAPGDLAPDIAMAKLDRLRVDVNTIKGRRLLRFRTKVVNIGDGPLELVGKRTSPKLPTMWVRQRIYNTSGGYRDIFLP